MVAIQFIQLALKRCHNGKHVHSDALKQKLPPLSRAKKLPVNMDVARLVSGCPPGLGGGQTGEDWTHDTRDLKSFKISSNKTIVVLSDNKVYFTLKAEGQRFILMFAAYI